MKTKLLSPIGKWKNSSGIRMSIYEIPDRSDDFSIQLVNDQINASCAVHLSRGKDNYFHIYDNEILGQGMLKIASTREMVIDTPKFQGLVLYRDYSRE